MKKVIYYILFAAPVMFGSSCTKGFGTFNLNPDGVTSVKPALEFSDVLVRTSSIDMEPRTNYCHAFMQYGYSDFWSGTTYTLSDGISSRYWNNFYAPVLKNLEYVITQTQTDTSLTTTYAAARIWRVFVYQKLTDFYGDIPYSKAGRALSAGVFTPTYDSQQQIYASFVTELREAIATLKATTKPVQGDQFYNGSSAQWAKLGASLLLRVGMRLIKVDATQASALVKEAIAAGVMASNADMPVLKHNLLVPNGFNFNLGDQHFFLHKTLVDRMKATSDPRLAIYGAIHSAAKGSIISTDTSKYYGYSFKSTDSAANVRVSYPIYRPEATPFFEFQYAEVEYLWAEAILRGYTTGDPNTHYIAGVTAHMQSLALLPTNPTISGTQITAYLTKNPLVNPANPTVAAQIETINTEFWIAGFIFDADEAWYNWRRTGYPKLVPNPNTLTGPSSSPGVIPRKMPYPQNEFNLNSVSVTQALTTYGGLNDFGARVWWDK